MTVNARHSMTPDKSILLASWLNYTSGNHPLQPDGLQFAFDMASRENIVDVLHRHLSAPQKNEVCSSSLPDTAAAEVASAFAREAIENKLCVDGLKCEANALCIALLVTMPATNEGMDDAVSTVEIRPSRLMEFVSTFSTIVGDQFLQGVASRNEEHIHNPANSDEPPRNESLQHALRSPLQGAILFLDLMREDVQSGKVSLEDVDSVITSLNHIVHLLDDNRDRQN